MFSMITVVCHIRPMAQGPIVSCVSDDLGVFNKVVFNQVVVNQVVVRDMHVGEYSTLSISEIVQDLWKTVFDREANSEGKNEEYKS